MKFFSDMKDGKCSNCGNCCGNFLPLTETEINIIRIHIKAHQITKMNKNPLKCPFRDEENKKCTIYEVRPFICKMWRCDGQMTPKQNKQLLKKRRMPVNMRALFFGK